MNKMKNSWGKKPVMLIMAALQLSRVDRDIKMLNKTTVGTEAFL